TLLEAQRGNLGPVEGALLAAVDANHPDAVLILEALTQGYMLNLRHAAALAALRRLIERDPDNVQAHRWHASLSEQVHSLDAAAESYSKALTLEPEHFPTRLQLARLALSAGRVAVARDHFQRLYQTHPGAIEVLLGLAECRRLE